jgi:hypothetical protein
MEGIMRYTIVRNGLFALLVLILSFVAVHMIYGGLLFASEDDYEAFILISGSDDHIDILIEITGVEMADSKMTFDKIVFDQQFGLTAIFNDGSDWQAFSIGDYYATQASLPFSFDDVDGARVKSITFKFFIFTKTFKVDQDNVLYIED